MEIIPVPNEDFFSQKFPEPEYPAPPMPECKPPKPTTEEVLKRALEFANKGIEDNEPVFGIISDYTDGKFRAFELMATYLEMLIKEIKQNG